MTAIKRRSRAFTLVELLVVIAIIGILVALLLPAIQAAREAARRTQCSNNLKQLGIALQNYHDTYHRFPAGCSATGDPWSGGIHRKGSMLVKLLPYVEQSALYDEIDFNRDVTDWIWNNHRWTNIPAYLCPSDPGGNFDRAVSNYGASMGAQAMGSQGGWCTMYPGHINGPTGHGSSNNPANISGVFSRFFWSARLRDVTDGTSTTIAMGEMRPNCGDHHRQGWFHGNALWTATTAPINFPTCPGEPQYQASSCFAENNWQTSQGFKSKHPGGAQFVFCDSSVHFINESIDYQTYQYLGARADKNVVGSF